MEAAGGKVDVIQLVVLAVQGNVADAQVLNAETLGRNQLHIRALGVGGAEGDLAGGQLGGDRLVDNVDGDRRWPAPHPALQDNGGVDFQGLLGGIRTQPVGVQHQVVIILLAVAGGDAQAVQQLHRFRPKIPHLGILIEQHRHIHAGIPGVDGHGLGGNLGHGLLDGELQGLRGGQVFRILPGQHLDGGNVGGLHLGNILRQVADNLQSPVVYRPQVEVVVQFLVFEPGALDDGGLIGRSIPVVLRGNDRLIFLGQGNVNPGVIRGGEQLLGGLGVHQVGFQDGGLVHHLHGAGQSLLNARIPVGNQAQHLGNAHVPGCNLHGS